MALRVGIAGLGFGINHLHSCLTRDDCVVVAVADGAADRRAPAEALGIAGFDRAEDMVETAGLDALIIATPPHTRAGTIDAAKAKGVPLFLEKPIAGTPAAAEAVVAQLDGHRAMMGFSFRFHAPVQTLLARIKGADLGAPQLGFGSYMFNWLPPSGNWLWDRETGGGFFNENSCHLIDIVEAVMGRIERVYAEPFYGGDRPGPTGASVTFAIEGGASAAVTIGGHGVSGQSRFPLLDVTFEHARARLIGADHKWTGLELAVGQGDVMSFHADPETLGRTRYSAALDHFFGSVRDGRPFEATPEDGVRAVRVADAIYRSIDAGAPAAVLDTKETGR
ncbi:Gfo/Idh/MocA family protein [Oceanomicrobium pacificus]|uniref:Gfo/Idh/MocA family oxidoreductase n=1 Tax=Oceanomicrobium pacificus TaxID=2692916 RepID=A0A6B0TZS7_9RHOB|nr:Gfo/Idh/MocA family oxidoreductase [Oceanomicrobium pacificus]MXU64391.1 Gfo/Idh/MocA family oxidoreductase [Oceanomicrobium pacificus]